MDVKCLAHRKHSINVIIVVIVIKINFLYGDFLLVLCYKYFFDDLSLVKCIAVYKSLSLTTALKNIFQAINQKKECWKRLRRLH